MISLYFPSGDPESIEFSTGVKIVGTSVYAVVIIDRDFVVFSDKNKVVLSRNFASERIHNRRVKLDATSDSLLFQAI